MKYYRYEGRIYKSHNKETLMRRLSSKAFVPWGRRLQNIKRMAAKIDRLYGFQED